VSSATLTGPVPNASLSGSYTAPVAINNPANAIGGNFSGNAIGLTNLNASQLNTGSVPDARLSANVALLNNNQTFSGSNVFNNQVQFGANAIHILGTASSTMAMLGNGNWFPGPVPYFRPAFPNSQSPMDVMPNGSTVTNRGSAWIDVCSSDITLDSGNWEAKLRFGINEAKRNRPNTEPRPKRVWRQRRYRDCQSGSIASCKEYGSCAGLHYILICTRHYV
jgi:hypothetical protein